MRRAFKDGAYYCYCAYVLRISRYSDFLSPMLTNRIKKCGSNSKTIAIVWRCRYCLKRKFCNNSFRTYINGRLIHEGDSNLPIITVAGNLNIRRERSMSNQTRGRGLVLHFDGTHWILREGRSRQQMSLYPVVIFHRRKIAFIMHEFWKLN